MIRKTNKTGSVNVTQLTQRNYVLCADNQCIFDDCAAECVCVHRIVGPDTAATSARAQTYHRRRMPSDPSGVRAGVRVCIRIVVCLSY